MTILVIDDEPMVLAIERMALERAGFSVITAMSPGEAIRLFEPHRHEIDLAVIDVSLAGDNGFAIAAELRRMRPDLRALFVLGYAGAGVGLRYDFDGERMNLLVKPFLPAELVVVKDQIPTLPHESAHA